MKIRDTNIQVLRIKLNTPAAEHVQTQDLEVVTKEEKILLSLMIEENKKLNQLEKQVEQNERKS